VDLLKAVFSDRALYEAGGSRTALSTSSNLSGYIVRGFRFFDADFAGVFIGIEFQQNIDEIQPLKVCLSKTK